MTVARPLHVLVLPSWYPGPASPHAGIFFRDHARALAAAGMQVGVIAPRVAGYGMLLRGRLSPLGGVQEANDEGVRVLCRDVLAWLPRADARRGAFVAAGRHLFREYVRRAGMPDILHAHSALPAGELGAVLAHDTGLPWVVTEHGSRYLLGTLDARERAAATRVFTAAGAAVAVSDALRVALARQYPRPAGWLQVPNVVAPEFFQGPPARRRRDAPVFLAVGNLVPEKGFDLLLQAFAGIPAISPGATLRIVGDGVERPALVARAAALGLGDAVVFPGALPRDAVCAEMRAATCLVSSSRVETFGVAIVEALAMGLPVVATRCGGPDENVRDGAGYLVPPGDIDALRDAMVACAQGDGIADARVIREACARRFSGATVAARMQEIYRALAGSHGSRAVPGAPGTAAE